MGRLTLRNRTAFVVVATLALLVVSADVAHGQGAFPLGISSGDATSEAAILWTRAVGAGQVRVEVAADEQFQSVLTSAVLDAAEAADFTVKFEAVGLAPATRYFYRLAWLATGETSRIGTFVTAPGVEDPRSFRFAYSGDSNARDQPFHVLRHALAEQPDLWFWAGDTIYADITVPGEASAADLAGYRAKYRQNLADAHLQNLLASSPVWVQWDDHEVANDYDGGDLEPHISPQRQTEGYQAFFEYLPIRAQQADGDPWRLYRSFPYGSLAEFFILDCRQYRSADVGREGGGFDPRAFFLPTFELGTIIRMHDPTRTMLGAEQLEWLKAGLRNSTATWKFILSSVPFTSLLVYPQDRWDGYDAERYNLLRFIDDNSINGVVILSADIHGNAHNPDVTFFLRNTLHECFSPCFAVPEFITGPIATATTQQELQEIAGAVLDGSPEQFASNPLFNIGLGIVVSRVVRENALAFVDMNRYAYLVVDVAPNGLTLRHRGVPPDPTAVDAEIETLHTATLTTPRDRVSLPCFLAPICLGLLAVGSAAAASAKKRRDHSVVRPRDCSEGDRRR